MGLTELPFLEVTRAGFSTRSAEVRAARAAHWCARTPFGLAVLRHREAGALLRDRRLRQGSYAWPEKIGLTGSFAEFWSRSIISQEGPGHKAQRQLAMAAMAPEWVERLVPDFERIAEDLAGALAQAGDFIARFTEPFAGRAITTLLDLPDAAAAEIAHDASRLGLAMGVDGKRHEPVFNAATDRLMDLAEELIDRGPREGDFVGRLVARIIAWANSWRAQTWRRLYAFWRAGSRPLNLQDRPRGCPTAVIPARPICH